MIKLKFKAKKKMTLEELKELDILYFKYLESRGIKSYYLNTSGTFLDYEADFVAHSFFVGMALSSLISFIFFQFNLVFTIFIFIVFLISGCVSLCTIKDSKILFFSERKLCNMSEISSATKLSDLIIRQNIPWWRIEKALTSKDSFSKFSNKDKSSVMKFLSKNLKEVKDE